MRSFLPIAIIMSRILFDYAECNSTLASLKVAVTVLNATVELLTSEVAEYAEHEAEAAAECSGDAVTGWTLSPHVAAFFIIVRELRVSARRGNFGGL